MLEVDGHLIKILDGSKGYPNKNAEQIRLALTTHPSAIEYLQDEEKTHEVISHALRICWRKGWNPYVYIVPFIHNRIDHEIVILLYQLCHNEREPTVAMPTHVKIRLIEHAVEHGELCPISFEPLTRENTTVTECGHLFSKGSLEEQTKCPTCRSPI